MSASGVGAAGVGAAGVGASGGGAPAWAGIDLGTQSVRSAVFGAGGEVVGRASRPLTSIRSPGRHEQDPLEWIRAVRTTLGAATAAAAAAGHRVEAIAVSGTSGTIVPVGADGRPIGRAVMYDDTRGAGVLGHVEAAGAELWRSLGYRMQPSWALPRLVAMLRDGTLAPDTLIAHQPDVVVSVLTGARAATDTSHALKTGVDLRTARWPAGVLHRLGVDVATLPEVRLPGEPLGRVSREAADELGLPAGCLVIGGMTDGCAAQIAAGALAVGDWNSVLGTTLVVKGAADTLRPDPSGAVYAHRAPFGAGWWPGGASSTGAGALTQWLPDADLAALTAAASVLTPDGPSYPLVGVGERFPFVAPSAVGFFDATAADSPAARFAAIAHGVAALERLAFDVLAVLGFDVSGRLFATGGGSANPWWVQLRADMLGRPVRVPAAADGAIGMAMLARAGAASTPLGEVAAAMLPPAPVVEPRPRAAHLDDLYHGFVERVVAEGWLAPGVGGGRRG